MVSPSSHNVPWELVSNSFLGELSNEEESQLQQWLDSDTANREKYEKLRSIWDEGLNEYKFYLLANEARAWNALKNKLPSGQSKTDNLAYHPALKLIYRIAAIAAIALIIFSVGSMFFSRGGRLIYETKVNGKRNINLADGTAVTLNPKTKIEIEKGYNSKNRIVVMVSGEASFNVRHKTKLPFVVNLGKAEVKDIGTVFKIKKDNEFVKVTVISGSVTFIRLSDNETRELKAGMSLTYNLTNDSFSEVQMGKAIVPEKNILLNFDNASLKDAVELIQKKFDKTIHIKGDSVALKKFTAHLEGLPFGTSMEIICKSLNLRYIMKDSIYILYETTDK